MKTFRKSRDSDGKFALTTLQNPLVELRSRLELIEAAAKDSAPPKEKSHPPATAPAPSPSPIPAPAPAAAATDTADRLAADIQLASTFPFLQKLAAQNLLGDFAPASTPELDSILEAASESVPSPAKCRRQAPKPKTAPRKLKSHGPFRGVASRLPARPLTNLERHSRKCLVCNHPNRADIDEDFLHWRRPERIMRDHDLPDSYCVYRHAHATGLFELRRVHIRFAAEMLVEKAEFIVPTGDVVLRAIRACSLIDDRGVWTDPPSRVIVSSGQMDVHHAPEASQPVLDVTHRELASEPRAGKDSEANLGTEVVPSPGSSNQPGEGVSNRNTCD